MITNYHTKISYLHVRQCLFGQTCDARYVRCSNCVFVVLFELKLLSKYLVIIIAYQQKRKIVYTVRT